jgi:hypothetical protein
LKKAVENLPVLIFDSADVAVSFVRRSAVRERRKGISIQDIRVVGDVAIQGFVLERVVQVWLPSFVDYLPAESVRKRASTPCTSNNWPEQNKSRPALFYPPLYPLRSESDMKLPTYQYCPVDVEH